MADAVAYLRDVDNKGCLMLNYTYVINVSEESVTKTDYKVHHCRIQNNML